MKRPTCWNDSTCGMRIALPDWKNWSFLIVGDFELESELSLFVTLPAPYSRFRLERESNRCWYSEWARSRFFSTLWNTPRTPKNNAKHNRKYLTIWIINLRVVLYVWVALLWMSHSPTQIRFCNFFEQNFTPRDGNFLPLESFF